MAGHTPGPWQIVPSGDGRLLIAGGRSPDPVTEARNIWVAEVYLPKPNPPGIDSMWDFLTVPEAMANARLISRAPRLLEVCQASLSCLEDDSRPGWRTWTVRELRRVIEEAGG
jgi:hypothetical protein